MTTKKRDTWSESQLDWMRHLVRTSQERTLKPERLEPQELKRLQWELKVQQCVLIAIAAGHSFSPLETLMATYMRAYADLHLEWYAGRMEGGAFRDAVQAAKAHLWEALAELAQRQKGNVIKQQ